MTKSLIRKAINGIESVERNALNAEIDGQTDNAADRSGPGRGGLERRRRPATRQTRPSVHAESVAQGHGRERSPTVTQRRRGTAGWPGSRSRSSHVASSGQNYGPKGRLGALGQQTGSNRPP
jgi:hypothetical protein